MTGRNGAFVILNLEECQEAVLAKFSNWLDQNLREEVRLS